MIKIILVPIDNSERSFAVLDTALVVARRFDAHIKVVHVVEETSEPYLFSGVPAALFGERQRISVGFMSGRSNVIWWLESNGYESQE